MPIDRSKYEQINKMCCMHMYMCIYIYIYIHTQIIEYYSALKSMGILRHARTWMNLENNMLSEIRHK